MCRVGIVGCGKLGTPVAVALAEKFPVKAFDVHPRNMQKRQYEQLERGPNGEDDFQERFDRSTLEFCNLETVVKESDIVFVSVQTPHAEKFDGAHRLPAERADFDYSFLAGACEMIAGWIRPQQTVAVISTVLPGTMRRVVVPILGDKCKTVYNPYFIAMGTVMHDHANPEFVLIGQNNDGDAHDLCCMYDEFYKDRRPPFHVMSLESAELTKVAYNTVVTEKITTFNLLGEIAHKTPGCNIDDVTDALADAKERLWSRKYTTAAVGDGGACHPRDNIAMSWLANKLNLSADLFSDMMRARERQTEWLVDLLCEHGKGLPKIIMGAAFKPDTNIIAGSPAILAARLLTERGEYFDQYDPHTDPHWVWPIYQPPSAILIMTKHSCFSGFRFTPGTVVVDPHRFVKPQEGVTVIPVGIGQPVA